MTQLARILNIIKFSPRNILNVSKERQGILIRTSPGATESLILEEKEFTQAYLAIIQEIESRANPELRVEWWETRDIDGIEDEKIEQRILSRRKNIKPKTLKPEDYDKNLKDFCKHRGIPSYMAKLYISELAQSNDPSDERAKNQARLLGLIS